MSHRKISFLIDIIIRCTLYSYCRLDNTFFFNTDRNEERIILTQNCYLFIINDNFFEKKKNDTITADILYF